MASSKDAVLLQVDGHEVRVSSPEKPYFAERGIRKIDVVEYFIAVGGGILHERQYLHGVRARGLRLDALDDIGDVPLQPLAGDGAPGLYRGTVTVQGAGDARLELPGWTRGFAWVNGFNLGRYWSAGPQRSLYVPGPVLREGDNEVWLLEFEEAAAGGALLQAL